jgi:hypothetical protein
MYLIALVLFAGILWSFILLASRSLLSRRYGHRLATNGITIVAFCSLIIVSITFIALNTNLEIRAHGNNPPVGAYGFAILFNLFASTAVFIGSAVVITIGAVILLEIYRWRQKVNKQLHIEQ